MTTYKDSGVDIEAGDNASKKAYERASSTFASRKGMIAEPVFEEGGFGGFLDMGDYYLIQTTDGTGTKIDIASEMQQFDTLGYDLLAMVADDAICTGAEVVSLSNCIDVPTVDPTMIDSMMSGLAKACTEQKIVIPAGEIAEVPGAVNRGVWSATAIGIVEKTKIIRTDSIAAGDTVLALRSGVARSNGFSLIRKILSDQYGEHWHSTQWHNGQTWGDVILTPSVIYHGAVLSLIGRYQEQAAVGVKGIAHITGGGIPSKFARTLKATGLGAELTDLWQPHDAIKDLISMGNVPLEEAYRTWNMGNGMLIVLDPTESDKAISLLSTHGIEAKVAGTVTQEKALVLDAYNDTRMTF